MRHCAPHEDNLALLAGGDLASVEEERVLREHLTACEGCRELFSALEGDLAMLVEMPGIAAQEADSLDAAVLQRLAATEAGPARRIGGSPHLRAAATILVVVTALAGALSLQSPTAPADGGMGVPLVPESEIAAKSPEEGLPIRVYRSGDSLELQWTGDGREAVPAGPATTYRVVASAIPDDFDGGRAVEVAGQRLVASNMPLPARRFGDRDLTFFRVE